MGTVFPRQHQGPVSKWSLRQDLLLKLSNLELESLTCLSLSSKSCLKLHLETGPWTPAIAHLTSLYTLEYEIVSWSNIKHHTAYRNLCSGKITEGNFVPAMPQCIGVCYSGGRWRYCMRQRPVSMKTRVWTNSTHYAYLRILIQILPSGRATLCVTVTSAQPKCTTSCTVKSITFDT